MNNVSFVHSSSFVDDGVTLGKGTKVWHFSHIQKGATLGSCCVLGQNVNIGTNVVVGNNVKIQNNVSVYSGVTIEDDVFLGPSMVFTNVLTPRSFIERKEEFANTLVKKGATIGANATIVCGVTIGEYALIGAGAVVTSDVPAHALMIGIPARLSGFVCACGEVLVSLGSMSNTAHTKGKSAISPWGNSHACSRCGKVYRLSPDGGEFVRES